MWSGGGRDRPRIAYVVHDYNRYLGHSRYVAELASRFRADCDVHVFTNRVDDPDTAGITFHHVPAWRRNALASILSFIVPATVHLRGRFDIIHAQGLCGFRHDLVTAHFCQKAWFDALRRNGMCLTWRQRLFQRLVTPLEQRALCQPATRRVIAISRRIKDDIARAYGRVSGVDVVYHGTDTTLFHPGNAERYRALIRDHLGLQASQCVALYVGDLKKGAAAAIQAVGKVPGLVLLIISGSDQARHQALAEAAGISDRIVFHGHTRHVERFLAAADVFLFPTVYDPFGMVITEAMATGLPVVTSRMAGASELIDHGVEGLLTDSSWDVPLLASLLEQLRDDAALRSRIGMAGRRRIEAFTWQRTAEETMACYEKFLAARS